MSELKNKASVVPIFSGDMIDVSDMVWVWCPYFALSQLFLYFSYYGDTIPMNNTQVLDVQWIHKVKSMNED